MGSAIIPIIITLLIGGIFYFLIQVFQLTGMIKTVITLVVMFAAYTLLAEAMQNKYTD